ncbi:hypothetical protein AVEN_190201-1, partial [Araneus ventricosus]
MKNTRTRAKNDVIGSRRSEPIILSDFLPQFYQGRVCKYAPGTAFFQEYGDFLEFHCNKKSDKPQK